jgi:hypothetical protein
VIYWIEEEFEDTKRKSECINRRRTDNTIVKRKRTNRVIRAAIRRRNAIQWRTKRQTIVGEKNCTEIE